MCDLIMCVFKISGNTPEYFVIFTYQREMYWKLCNDFQFAEGTLLNIT